MAKPATTTETDAILAAIATTHLGLTTLESRKSDGLDFKDHACWAIRDALRAAYDAGRRARRHSGGRAIRPLPIAGDIVLTSPTPAPDRGGWVEGRVGQFRFCAKVYPEHALNPTFEIGRSRISKLELRRLDSDLVAYAWDRGLDTAAIDDATQRAVDGLVTHLAAHCFGPAA